MTEPFPIYLLCGENEFAIDEFIAGLTTPTGSDSTITSMNTSYLDGRTHTYDDLVKAVQAMPFLLDHRLVLFAHPTSLFKHLTHQKKLTDLMEHLPPTTLLFLTEDHELTSSNDRKKGKTHWLERWALASGGRAVFMQFPVPLGPNLTTWVQERAEKAGGKFTPKAADELILRTGPLPRMLDQEISKLLAYVNYARPVAPDDVQHVTPLTAPVPNFALINAVRDQNTSQAFSYLKRELEEKEPIMIFFSFTQQFRIVLQAREIMDQGGGKDDVARLLHMHPYAAEQAFKHARFFSLPALEAIYHRLLELDAGIKTGRMDSELALDMLLLELTNASL